MTGQIKDSDPLKNKLDPISMNYISRLQKKVGFFLTDFLKIIIEDKPDV